MMKNKKRNKLLSIVLTLVLAFCVTTGVSAAQNGSFDIAMYRDWEFTWRSAPEPIELTEDIDTISLFGTCVGDQVDEDVACHIVDVTHGVYDSILYFPADGSVTTIARALPAGEYRVYFTGDSNIEKAEATVVFTVLD